MAALLVAGFVGLFSETALNIALGELSQIFNVDATTIQWLATGYFLNIRYFSTGNRYFDAKIYYTPNVHNFYIVIPYRYNFSSSSTVFSVLIGGTYYSSSRISD